MLLEKRSRCVCYIFLSTGVRSFLNSSLRYYAIYLPDNDTYWAILDLRNLPTLPTVVNCTSSMRWSITGIYRSEYLQITIKVILSCVDKKCSGNISRCTHTSSLIHKVFAGRTTCFPRVALRVLRAPYNILSRLSQSLLPRFAWQGHNKCGKTRTSSSLELIAVRNRMRRVYVYGIHVLFLSCLMNR